MKNSKYNILFCSPALTFGGEQKQMVQILNHLDRERFNVTICSIRPFGHLDKSLTESGAPIICLNRPSPYDPRAIQDLRHLIKERNIDLVQIGIFGSEFHGILASLSSGTPVMAILESSYDLDARAESSGGQGKGLYSESARSDQLQQDKGRQYSEDVPNDSLEKASKIRISYQ